jgi:hypothetical protein
VRPRDEGFQVLLGPRPGKRHYRGAHCKRRGKAVFLDVEEEKIQSEAVVGPLTDRRRPGSDLVRVHVVTAHRAETARARHRGHELGRIDRSHAAERNRMLDIQQVADRRPDHGFLPVAILSLSR